jgi:hypothetical protein
MSVLSLFPSLQGGSLLPFSYSSTIDAFAITVDAFAITVETVAFPVEAVHHFRDPTARSKSPHWFVYCFEIINSRLGSPDSAYHFFDFGEIDNYLYRINNNRGRLARPERVGMLIPP